MKIGDKLPILRKRCGLSQEDLANELDVSRQSVYKWETGESQPDIAKIQKMAKILGVSFDYLLDENIDVTKVDDVPKDIISTDIKYRAVFNSGKELSWEKADEDHGIFPKDEYDEVEEKGILARNPIQIDVLNLDKELATNTFETNKKKMIEYLDSKGYSWLMPHPDACVAFFTDDKNKTFGFWYDGAEQFVCPIENLIDIKFSNNGGDIKTTRKPKVGLLLGGIFGVGVDSEESVSIDKPAFYDIDITYFNEDETSADFKITFNKNNAYWFTQMKFSDIDELTAMQDVIADCIVENMNKIDSKIKALKMFVDKIRTNKIKVENINKEELSNKAKEAETEHTNGIKNLKKKFVEIKMAKNKKKLIRNLIIVGAVALIFGILCLV